MSYIVIDLETTSTRDPARGLHPYGDNEITHVGWKMEDEHHAATARLFDQQRPTFWFGPSRVTEEVVGCNLAFDLGFLLAKQCCMPNEIPEVTWDVAIFDYLWYGQEKFPSLDKIAARWLVGQDGNQKSADIGELISKYGDTDKIPEEEIVPYLIQDVELTERVYLAQKKVFEQCDEQFMFLIASEFAACRENILATHRGIPLDMLSLQQEQQSLVLRTSSLETHFAQALLALAGKQVNEFIPDNLINSTKFCQQLLYSPQIQITGKLVAGKFKSGLKKGQVKYKSHTEVVTLPDPMDSLEGMNTDEEKLTQYLTGKIISAPSRAYFIDTILQYRSCLKSLTTYCGNLIKYQVQDILHPLYQQTATGTGRISSSKPNIQNQP